MAPALRRSRRGSGSSATIRGRITQIRHQPDRRIADDGLERQADPALDHLPTLPIVGLQLQ